MEGLQNKSLLNKVSRKFDAIRNSFQFTLEDFSVKFHGAEKSPTESPTFKISKFPSYEAQNSQIRKFPSSRKFENFEKTAQLRLAGLIK